MGLWLSTEGHAYSGMVEGLPLECSEVIHHIAGCIGFTITHRSTVADLTATEHQFAEGKKTFKAMPKGD